MKDDHIQLREGKIIYWRPQNPQGDIEGTRTDTKAILKLAKSQNGPVSLLVDLSLSEMPNLEQKKEIAHAGKKVTFEKIAVYNYSWRLKLAVDFIVKLIGNLEVRLCKSEQEALDWLNNSKV